MCVECEVYMFVHAESLQQEKLAGNSGSLTPSLVCRGEGKGLW